MPQQLVTPDFIEDPDFIPQEEENDGTQSQVRMMPRMRNGQPSDPTLTRIPNPMAGLEGEGDNTGLTLARNPTFLDRVGSAMDQDLRQVPEALMRTVSGKSNQRDRDLGAAVKANAVGPDSDPTWRKVLAGASYGPRMIYDSLEGAVKDPAGTLGHIGSGIVAGEMTGGGARSAAPEVEAEARASSNGSGLGRSGPGGSGTRMTVPPSAAEGASTSPVSKLLKKGGLGNDVTSFVIGHRGSKLMDMAGKLLGANGEEPTPAPVPAPASRTTPAAPTDTQLPFTKEGVPTHSGIRTRPWQSQPNVDVAEGGHSVKATIQDQSSTAGQQGSADRIPNGVEMSPAPAKLVRRSGYNPDLTRVKPQSAYPSPEYDPAAENGPKSQDTGQKARQDLPPIPRGDRRARVRTPEELENNKFWKQARAESGETTERGAVQNGKQSHTGVGTVSAADTDAIEARVKELKAQAATTKLQKKGNVSVTKVPSSGVGSVGDINPHPRQYHPEQPMPDDAVSNALGLKKKRR